MAELSIAERSLASRNAMLSAKVCKAIRSVMKGSELSQREQEILGRGAELLSKIREGSLLIDHQQVGETYSRADLKAYSHAVSALERFSVFSSDGDFTEIFSRFQQDLEKLSNGRNGLSREDATRLWLFFRELNQMFFRDVNNSSPPDRKHVFLARAFA